MSSSRASFEPEPETPAQALARALNPARWNLGINKKTDSTVAMSASNPQQGDKPGNETVESDTKFIRSQATGGKQELAGSGDIGESMFQEDDDDQSVQKADKASGEAHYDDQAGLPKPDDVMAKVPETRTKEETAASASASASAKRSSFMDGLKADWNKMFGARPAPARSEQGSLAEGDDEEERREDKVDAQAPGILDAAKDTDRPIEVDDGEVKQEAEETLPTSTATTGQRKDLEIKIIREIVRSLGGGTSPAHP